MKKILCFFAVLALGVSAVFAGDCHSVVFRHKDGSETSVSYQKGMKMTFEDRVLVLSGTDAADGVTPASFQYEFDDLDGFRFDSGEGDLKFSDAGTLTSESFEVAVDGLVLTAAGLRAGEQGRVFDLQGRVLLQLEAADNGVLTIDLSSLHATTAIIKISTFTTKIRIK